MRKKILNDLLSNKVFAVLRITDSSKTLKIVEAILNGGVKNIELTMTSDRPLESLRLVCKEFENQGYFGMGSVKKTDEVNNAIDAGASFIVSPILKEEIIIETHKHNLPVFPGSFTPTEIYSAYEFGADVIKIFPADILGMKFFKSILSPLPELKIMPTGGVSLVNAGEWFSYGACAVGIGSALIDAEAVENNDFKTITQNAEMIIQSIKQM